MWQRGHEALFARPHLAGDLDCELVVPACVDCALIGLETNPVPSECAAELDEKSPRQDSRHRLLRAAEHAADECETDDRVHRNDDQGAPDVV